METDHSIRNAFQMPTPMKISGRSSSITAAFVSAIVPQVYPTDDEIKTALDILGMSPANISCAYCGAQTTEWDHLRPLVANQKPTGFISDIRNLVPSCGKCNQSKGNKYWLDWIVSGAKWSRKSRRILNLEQRIARLKKYERWGDVKPIDLPSMIPPDEWEKHWANCRVALTRLLNNPLDCPTAGISPITTTAKSVERMEPTRRFMDEGFWAIMEMCTPNYSTRRSKQG